MSYGPLITEFTPSVLYLYRKQFLLFLLRGLGWDLQLSLVFYVNRLKLTALCRRQKISDKGLLFQMFTIRSIVYATAYISLAPRILTLSSLGIRWTPIYWFRLLYAEICKNYNTKLYAFLISLCKILVRSNLWDRDCSDRVKTHITEDCLLIFHLFVTTLPTLSFQTPFDLLLLYANHFCFTLYPLTKDGRKYAQCVFVLATHIYRHLSISRP